MQSIDHRSTGDGANAGDEQGLHGHANGFTRRSPPTPVDTTDVAQEGRVLLEHFVFERLQAEGIEDVAVLYTPDSPDGPPLEHIRRIGVLLQQIGDNLDADQDLYNTVESVTGIIETGNEGAVQGLVQRVARQILDTPEVSWARVAAVFYFAYRLIKQVVTHTNVVRTIVDSIGVVISDYIAPWVAAHGGWDHIEQFYGNNGWESIIPLLLGASLALGLVLYQWLYN